MADSTSGAGQRALLEDIHTGMLVVDRDGREVGTVDAVYKGLPPEEAGATGQRPGTPPVSDLQQQHEPLPPAVPSPVDEPNPGPEQTLNEPEVRQGYIHVRSDDLSGANRYIPASALDRVEAPRVYLKARLDRS